MCNSDLEKKDALSSCKGRGASTVFAFLRNTLFPFSVCYPLIVCAYARGWVHLHVLPRILRMALLIVQRSPYLCGQYKSQRAANVSVFSL